MIWLKDEMRRNLGNEKGKEEKCSKDAKTKKIKRIWKNQKEKEK